MDHAHPCCTGAHHDASAVGVMYAVEDLDQGRLPSTVRAEESDELTMTDGEADSAERSGCPESLGDVDQFEDRLRPLRIADVEPLPSRRPPEYDRLSDQASSGGR